MRFHGDVVEGAGRQATLHQMNQPHLGGGEHVLGKHVETRALGCGWRRTRRTVEGKEPAMVGEALTRLRFGDPGPKQARGGSSGRAEEYVGRAIGIVRYFDPVVVALIAEASPRGRIADSLLLKITYSAGTEFVGPALR